MLPYCPKNPGKGLGPIVCVSPPNEEQLSKIFKRFDTNGDGYLSKEELKNAYNILGMSFPGIRAWWALCIADENGDGNISFEEFHKLVKNNTLR